MRLLFFHLLRKPYVLTNSFNVIYIQFLNDPNYASSSYTLTDLWLLLVKYRRNVRVDTSFFFSEEKISESLTGIELMIF